MAIGIATPPAGTAPEVTATPVTCMVTGSDTNGPIAYLFDTSTQTWSATTPVSGNTPYGQPNSFSGVSCHGLSSCVAVGSNYTSSNTDGPMAELWNGSDWTLMDTRAVSGSSGTPNFPAFEFASVSCPSATFCVAVGTKATAIGYQPEVDSWGTP